MSKTQPEIFTYTNQPETWDQKVNYDYLRRAQPEIVNTGSYVNDYSLFQDFMNIGAPYPPDLVTLDQPLLGILIMKTMLILKELNLKL